MWSSLIISKLSSFYWMELASLFLVRINLFFPFPAQWMLICYTLQCLGQMTLAKGFDDQFWYKSDMKKQERICIRWSVGEINSHLMLLNVCACYIHLKHTKASTVHKMMLGRGHGQSTGMRMAFLSEILYKCGIESLVRIKCDINYKTTGQRNSPLPTNSGMEKPGGKKPDFPYFSIH